MSLLGDARAICSSQCPRLKSFLACSRSIHNFSRRNIFLSPLNFKDENGSDLKVLNYYSWSMLFPFFCVLINYQSIIKQSPNRQNTIVISRFIKFSFGWWQLEQQMWKNNASELCWFVFVIYDCMTAPSMFLQRFSPMFWAALFNNKNPNHFFLGCHSFIHSFIHLWSKFIFWNQVWASVGQFFHSLPSFGKNLQFWFYLTQLQFHTHKWNWESGYNWGLVLQKECGSKDSQSRFSKKWKNRQWYMFSKNGKISNQPPTKTVGSLAVLSLKPPVIWGFQNNWNRRFFR